MTKKEIVKKISEEAKLTQLKTKEIVQMTFDAIIETLITEGRIELRNFGVFEVKTRKPRRARNPRTNEPVEVEAKNVVTFQPGKVMEERVRNMSLSASARPLVEDDDDDLDSADEVPAVVGAGVSMDGQMNGESSHEFAAVGADGDMPLKPR